MAIETYLQLDGILGDCSEPGYSGCIEVYSWSWGGSSNSVSFGSSGGGSGTVAFIDISMNIPVDRSGPALARCWTSGQRIPKGMLTSVKDGHMFLKVALEDIMVTSLQFGAGDPLSQSMALSFARFHTWYGNPAHPQSYGWDVQHSRSL